MLISLDSSAVHYPVSSSLDCWFILNFDAPFQSSTEQSLNTKGMEQQAAKSVNGNRHLYNRYHVLKLTLIGQDWVVCAESAPKILFEATYFECPTFPISREFTEDLSGMAAVTIPFEAEPSALLVESILSNPHRRPCGLNELIDGVWSRGAFLPFNCSITEFSRADAQACLQNRSIVVFGNSVMRGFFTGLMRLVSDKYPLAADLPRTKQLSSTGTIVESNWWSRLAEKALCPKIDDVGSLHGKLQVKGRPHWFLSFAHLCCSKAR